MPRDKTESHERIVAAAMREFMEKGYERASMKDVADAVGMTSAALYRHFDSKQAMFGSLVEPAVAALEAWTNKHVGSSYDVLNSGNMAHIMDFDSELSDSRMILDVMYAQPEAFRLLLFRSAGTPFESFLHDKAEDATDQMMDFRTQCLEHGLPVMDIRRDEMHMLVSAYLSAMIQPIEHGLPIEDAERYLRTIQEFFAPGWKLILGAN